MDFVASQDFKTPYVVATGQPHKPQEIKMKHFKKGEIITGEIKTVKGKPAFIIHKGALMIPLSCVKQVVVKDIQIGADGNKDQNPKVEVKVLKTSDQKNKSYLDGIILGALAGFGATILAEKQGWLTNVDKKTKITGAIIGAVVGMYAVYRFKK